MISSRECLDRSKGSLQARQHQNSPLCRDKPTKIRWIHEPLLHVTIVPSKSHSSYLRDNAEHLASCPGLRLHGPGSASISGSVPRQHLYTPMMGNFVHKMYCDRWPNIDCVTSSAQVFYEVLYAPSFSEDATTSPAHSRPSSRTGMERESYPESQF